MGFILVLEFREVMVDWGREKEDSKVILEFHLEKLDGCVCPHRHGEGGRVGCPDWTYENGVS